MSTVSSLRLLALHGVRLKGTVDVDDLAAAFDAPADVVRDELDALVAGDLLRYRYGRMSGYSLTPEGRVLEARLLAEELAGSGAGPALADAYERFLPVNAELLAVCTAWQLRPVDGELVPNDHADEAYDAGVVQRLADVHERAEPILDEIVGLLPRFAMHQRRLRAALERVRAGERDHFTTPMFPSYHSTWFELHEDLLATLGRERTPGGGAGADTRRT